MKTKKVSVCIPTYECKGKSKFFIEKLITSILKQTYDNLEIVISDHSSNDVVETYIKELNNTKIVYIKNLEGIGNPAHNTNNAIKNSTGDFIKIMNMDDFIESPSLIQDMITLLDDTHNWVLSSFKHLNYKNNVIFNYMTPQIYGDGSGLLDGINTVGCPSVCLIPKNEYFDPNVKYMIDCDLWYRLFKKYNKPAVHLKNDIVIGVGDHSLSSQIYNEQKKLLEEDINYCKKKYIK